MSSRGYYWYGFIAKVFDLCVGELRYRISQLSKFNLIPSFLMKWINLLVQDYSGDLTINHKPSIFEYSNIISNPSKVLCEHFRRRGELRTFSGILALKI